MASTIQVRVDDDLKKKSDNLFKEDVYKRQMYLYAFPITL